ncbi:MAG: hypothetical protein ACRDJ1_10930 [Actinomycetota bacterium]
MPWGNHVTPRAVPRLTIAIAALLAGGLWAASTINPTVAPRVLGTTIWSGAVSLPSGFTVAAGQTVELNPTANTTVTLGANLIVQGVLRSYPAPGVTHVIKFTEINEAAFVGGGNVPLSTDKGLWVTDAGKLDLSGAAKLPWTRAAASLVAGATTVTLQAAPVGWQVGDEILIAPTEKPTVVNFSARHEVRTITSVSGSTVGFTALSYPHPAVTVKPGVTYGAEIANLTRNLRIEGQDATHRTHVWMKSSVPQSIRNVAIRYAGPQKGSPADTVLGRYGLHFHRMGDGSRGSLVEGVVVRQTGGTAFATHASNGVTLRNTIAFDTQDVSYWYDPGAPEAPNDTLYDGALAGYVRPTPLQGQGYRLTGFWLGLGSGNACRRCVAFGVQGAKNASGFGWPEGEFGIWTFEDSIAHNNKRDGIFVWQNHAIGHSIDRFVAYYNGYAGIEHGAYTNEYHFRDNILFGNSQAGVVLHATSPNAPPLTSFEKTYVDGAGISKNAVLLERPTNLDQPPTLWCGATIVNLTGPAYLVNYTGSDSTIAERLDIKAAC